MNIAFNGVKCGWGNNGGTQSIMRMAGALCDLGHQVELWSNVGSRFTWFKPHPHIKFVKCCNKNAPYADAVISTSCKTIWDTYTHPDKQVGVCWLRGHETWTWKHDQLMALYNLDMPLWVNSAWMRDMIVKENGRTDIELQYCGLPLEQFYLEKDCVSLLPTIGALYSDKASKGFKHVRRLMKALPEARYVFYGDGKMDHPNFVRRPDVSAKRRLYSKCSVWYAPSCLEGMHIPPIEAALCGTPVIANRKASAGNMDWLIDGESGLLVDPADTDSVIKAYETIFSGKGRRFADNAQKIIRRDIGSVAEAAERFQAKLIKAIQAKKG